MSTASNKKLPVVFCVEDNGYAISTPVEVNTPGGNISRLVANFPDFYFAEVDGTDPEASSQAFQAAVAHCRAGLGPAFVHGHCIRPYSHSLSDDERLYRSKAELKADSERDPLLRMQMRLLREGILTADEPPPPRWRRRCPRSRRLGGTSIPRIWTPQAWFLPPSRPPRRVP
jgi:2-oxoisovalerate dehydrogenase E1 component